MPPTVSNSPPPRIENFYQNSFKQLSNVQQKQVGLLLGAFVADGAARRFEGYTKEEVEAMQKERSRHMDSHFTAAEGAVRKEVGLEFWPVDEASQLRGHKSLATLDVASQGHSLRRHGEATNPLLQHSFSAQFFEEIVRTISHEKGDFPVETVTDKLVDISLRVAPEVFLAEHASLLHTLCALLPLPTIYPYVSDEHMRAYAAPFVEFLTEPPQALSGEEKVSFLEGDGGYTLQEAAAAERTLVERMTFSVLGVATRCLQSNPDPLRNAAFMSVPDSSAVFPPEVVEHCPRLPAEDLASIKALRISEDLLRRTTQRSPLLSSAFLPRRPVLLDAITVREGLTIVRSAASYTSGVRAAIGLGGPVCQRAMLVGALLGAKYGARHIPPGWLSATARHKVLSTFSIDVAQWAWNPPHH